MNQNTELVLNELKKDRLQKVKKLLIYIDEVIKNNNKYLSNDKFDFLQIKTNLSDDKQNTVAKHFEIMMSEMAKINHQNEKPCQLEEFLRVNFKYLNIETIILEEINFHPFTFDISKEFFYHTTGELNKIKIENIKPENHHIYLEILKQCVSIQELVIQKLTIKSQYDFEQRQEKLKQEQKISPAEVLYIEAFLAKLQRYFELLIINTMQQNLQITSKKSNNPSKYSQDLQLEYEGLKTKTLDYIKTYEPVRFLPENYMEDFLIQLNLIEKFVLKDDEGYKSKYLHL